MCIHFAYTDADKCYKKKKKKWPNVFGIDSQGEAPFRIGDIISFVEHDIVVSSLNAQSANSSPTTKTHILAHLRWYGDHPC